MKGGERQQPHLQRRGKTPSGDKRRSNGGEEVDQQRDDCELMVRGALKQSPEAVEGLVTGAGGQASFNETSPSPPHRHQPHSTHQFSVRTAAKAKEGKINPMFDAPPSQPIDPKGSETPIACTRWDTGGKRGELSTSTNGSRKTLKIYSFQLASFSSVLLVKKKTIVEWRRHND